MFRNLFYNVKLLCCKEAKNIQKTHDFKLLAGLVIFILVLGVASNLVPHYADAKKNGVHSTKHKEEIRNKICGTTLCVGPHKVTSQSNTMNTKTSHEKVMPNVNATK